MEQLLKISKKFFAVSLLSVVLFFLSFGFTLSVFAQTLTGTENYGQGTQAYGYTSGAQPSGNVSGKAITSGVTSGVTGCVSSVVSGLVSKVVGNLIGSATNMDKYRWVSTTNFQVDTQSGGSVGWPPSFDSIAYCIINAMIEYLADATIDWINSGFDGNPAFVKDPKTFFSDLGDQAAAGLIQDVIGGATGIDVCQPFRVDISTGLGAGSGSGYAGDFGSRSKCTLGDIAASAQDFQVYTSGNSSQSGNFDTFYNMSQNDQNNPYGMYFMAQEELSRRVALQQNTAHVDMSLGNGFLSVKKCSEDSSYTGSDGTTHKVAGVCGYTTPGHMIEDAANTKLKAGDNRLVLADKFDQVVSTLINQLIKTALSSLLDNTGK